MADVVLKVKRQKKAVASVVTTIKRKTSKNMIESVVSELVGSDALPIVHYLKGKQNISEFIIAEELDMEIHQTRRLLYKLLEQNILSFKRKKDKIKGWYICYWDFNEKMIPHHHDNIQKKKLDMLQERLSKEEDNMFYMCRNACIRMDFEKSMDFDFKCHECGEIMQEQDNARTIEFLREKISEFNTVA